MKSFNSKFKILSLALGAILLWGGSWGCRKAPMTAITPRTPLQDYHSPAGTTLETSAKLWNVETKEDVSQGLTLRKDEGIYTIVEVQLTPEQTLDPAVLSDARRWACLAIIFPKGTGPSARDSVEFGPEPIFTNNRPMCSIVKSPLDHSKSPAYRGTMLLPLSPAIPNRAIHQAGENNTTVKSPPPVIHKSFPENVSAYWTFLDGSQHTPGEYVLQIRMFPCLDSFSQGPKILDSIVVLQAPFIVIP